MSVFKQENIQEIGRLVDDRIRSSRVSDDRIVLGAPCFVIESEHDHRTAVRRYAATAAPDGAQASFRETVAHRICISMLKTERVTTGIAGLDNLIGGGFPANRSFLVTGEPGTGKTIFALQFLLEGLARGENGVYVAADENLSDVMEQAASLGWDLERYTRTNALSILNAGSYVSSLPTPGREKHVDVTRAIRDLSSHVDQTAAKRLVLDPAGPFVLLRDSAARIQDQTRLLIKLLRSSIKTTNLLTAYAVPRTGEKTRHGIEEYLVAGVITLRMAWQDRRAVRALGIPKMRCTNVKPAQYEFEIVTGKGIVLIEER